MNSLRPRGGWVGSTTFVIAATEAFRELQDALHTIWRVKLNPGANLRVLLMDRVRSFGLAVAIGFLLMVSLAVTAGLSALECGQLDTLDFTGELILFNTEARSTASTARLCAQRN